MARESAPQGRRRPRHVALGGDAERLGCRARLPPKRRRARPRRRSRGGRASLPRRRRRRGRELVAEAPLGDVAPRRRLARGVLRAVGDDEVEPREAEERPALPAPGAIEAIEGAPSGETPSGETPSRRPRKPPIIRSGGVGIRRLRVLRLRPPRRRRRAERDRRRERGENPAVRTLRIVRPTRVIIIGHFFVGRGAEKRPERGVWTRARGVDEARRRSLRRLLRRRLRRSRRIRRLGERLGGVRELVPRLARRAPGRVRGEGVRDERAESPPLRATRARVRSGARSLNARAARRSCVSRVARSPTPATGEYKTPDASPVIVARSPRSAPAASAQDASAQDVVVEVEPPRRTPVARSSAVSENLFRFRF